MSCSLCSQNTDPPTDLSYFRLVEYPQRQVCKCVQTIPLSLPPSPSLFISASPLTPLPPSLPRAKAEKPQQDGDESHIVHRAEFGRPQIRDSGKVGYDKRIRLSNGFKGRSSVSQTADTGGEEKRSRRSTEGVCTSHLQNIGLWETIDKSTAEFPGNCADKCVHTEWHTVHQKAQEGHTGIPKRAQRAARLPHTHRAGRLIFVCAPKFISLF